MKPKSDFYYQKRHSKLQGDFIYYYPECKECTKKRSFAWNENNRERFRENLNNYTKTENRQKGMRRNSANQRLSGKQRAWRLNNKDKTIKIKPDHIRYMMNIKGENDG